MITAQLPHRLTQQELHMLSPQTFNLANIYDEDRNVFAPPQGCFLVVKDEETDSYAACAAFKPANTETCPQTCQMVHFVVTYHNRGKGLGGKLMKTIIQEARAAGYTKILAEMEPWCPEWRAFYSANGFQFVDESARNNLTGSTPVQLMLN